MKKIVLNASELISISDVSDYSKVGFQWVNGKKSIVIRTPSGFFGMDDSLEICHAWCKATMQEYIENGLKQEGAQAFYFNKSSELFKWMSEQ
jgi:hypothetical protein